MSAGCFSAQTCLQNGNVFIVGGLYASDQSASNSAEIYNPADEHVDGGRQRSGGEVGNQPTEVLANGTLMVGTLSQFPGWGPVGETEIYNPTTNSWSQAGNTQSSQIRSMPILG